MFGLHKASYACLIALLSLVMMGSAAFGQTETARISGTVSDSTGAVVPGSRVTFIHVSTNTINSTEAGADGQFLSVPLRIGEYRVEVEAEGFKKYVRSGIVLQLNETAVVNAIVELGSVTETIDVTADAPLLETAQATQGQVIDNARMVDMPLNGRNYIQLALLSAGTIEPLGGARTGGFSAGGMRTTENNYMLDGVDNNNVQIANQGRQAEAVRPPVDAIQEFKVSTNFL